MTKADSVTQADFEAFKLVCPEEAEAMERTKGTLLNPKPYTQMDSFNKMLSETAFNYFVLGLHHSVQTVISGGETIDV